MNFFKLIILLSVPFFFACKNEQKEKEKLITQLVNEWQGKEIVFPENLIFTRYATDTTDYQLPNSEYKILIYIDSIGCTSCKLQLSKWKELIEYTNSVAKDKVPFLFFFHSADYKEIRHLLKRDSFNCPVCIDKADELNKLNKFPENMTFQTFLLNKHNKVVVVGNPVHNTTIKDLYIKQITGKENLTGSILKTIAKSNQTNIDFGTFKKNEIKTATIEIRNTGNAPLVIVDISTTCNCTIATYDRQPARPGESLQIGIKMTPKDTGIFNESLTVKYNSINKRVIKINIKGDVQ